MVVGALLIALSDMSSSLVRIAFISRPAVLAEDQSNRSYAISTLEWLSKHFPNINVAKDRKGSNSPNSNMLKSPYKWNYR
eukprot:4039517-Amphidinium_carterae.1